MMTNTLKTTLSKPRTAKKNQSLSKEEQVKATKRIAELELRLWGVLFGEPRTVSPLVDQLNSKLRALDDRELISQVRPLTVNMKKRAETAKKNRKNGPAYDRAVSALADRLWALDKDRLLVNCVRNEAIRIGTRRRANGDTTKSSHTRKVEKAGREVDMVRHAFIQANQGLVYLVAQRYRQSKNQLHFLDLVQEGNIGLIKGLNRFDYKQDVRFATYASWWVQSTISRAVMKKGSTIRVPASAIRKHNVVKNAELSLRKKTGLEPSEEAVAEEAGMDQNRIQRVKQPFRTTFCSLHDRVSSNGEIRYIDIVGDADAESPFDGALLNFWSEQVDEHLKVLTDQERDVIALRFGLDNTEEMTLERIGERYGLCRERIRQIQEKALQKLRERLAYKAA